MRTLFSGDLHVGYSRFSLMTGGWSSDDRQANFAGQVNGLCGAGVAGGLWSITGLHIGTVPWTRAVPCRPRWTRPRDRPVASSPTTPDRVTASRSWVCGR